ncbi:flagellar export protein FliJ [Clostridium tagluense]|uniref:flagellar export protein FliJ n=1 Tax=Clostridium tagluense TaxID=360422 RepID=UPI001C0B84A1|nr:flagellar export protein FliJ [Clostridium tagluense]MBU3126644.1 flagellar export protein FliJ [Clostridium tagluense]MCB2310012.1 flagellar export protein FliJ [Clostridium tagluense]MCB2314458.1 flagellar export protein FliJ [Clostridium tagluense]MCB2319306.1 flagellar export protein FliJ [Clostridium tagluense]MCB2324606.1 flagellar export protein FliJ [Clostridium tagluense]
MGDVYKFRLQKLLDIRKDIEDKSKLQFKEAQREKELVEDQLNNLKVKYEIYRNIDSYESVVEQKMKQNYLNALNLAIDETAVVLDDKEEILGQKRQELKQCQVEKKTVEILKENQQSAFLKEQNLIEQKTNDEFALYAFIRNNHKEGR